MIKVVYTGTRSPADVPGVEVVHLPMLERVPSALPATLPELLQDRTFSERFAVFYSRNAAEIAFEKLTPADFGGVEMWAVGAKTAAWLAQHLGRTVHRPARQDFTGVVEELREAVGETSLVVSFELEGSKHRLAESDLEGRVVSIDTYETMPCNWDDLDGLLRRVAPSWVVFASPRAFAVFRENLHHRVIGDSYRVAAIGPNTRDAIRAVGDRVDLVPPTPDIDALLRAIAGL